MFKQFNNIRGKWTVKLRVAHHVKAADRWGKLAFRIEHGLERVEVSGSDRKGWLAWVGGKRGW